MIDFLPTFPSLQILWECDPGWELECLQIQELQTGDSNTFAIGAWPRKKYYYHYPVTANRDSGSIVVSNYRTPPEWPGDPNWTHIAGTLTISLTRSGDPQSISWVREDSGERFPLKRGVDWQYFRSDNNAPEPRGKITVERIARPLQELMRKMLLATGQGCVISDCRIDACLEAAHLLPVKNGGNEILDNMILLRADLHRLFDADLLSFRIKNRLFQVFADPSIYDYVCSALGGKQANIQSDRTLNEKWLHARASLQPELRHVRVDA